MEHQTITLVEGLKDFNAQLAAMAAARKQDAPADESM
jgi:hypothetical protein